jgi:hypothetical protein
MARRPATIGTRHRVDFASTTPESVALAKQLRRWGFRLLGPTTAYAATGDWSDDGIEPAILTVARFQEPFCRVHRVRSCW